MTPSAFRRPTSCSELVLSEPELAGFLAWDALKEKPDGCPLGRAADRRRTLNVQGGDAFLVTTAALEFLRNKDTFAAPAEESKAESDA